MSTNIAVIMGHPSSASYCSALSAAYMKGAIASGADIRMIDLSKMQFDPILKHGFHERTPLEEDLLVAQEIIQWAHHLVFVYPTWWGTMPALLKGFIDRVFLPGFAFKYRTDSKLWDKLLKGKSARLIVTMDTPSWYNRMIYRQSGYKVMKRSILQFCGINPVEITELSPIKTSSAQVRSKWLGQVEKLGSELK